VGLPAVGNAILFLPGWESGKWVLGDALIYAVDDCHSQRSCGAPFMAALVARCVIPAGGQYPAAAVGRQGRQLHFQEVFRAVLQAVKFCV
jgi:hypothetical protein